LRLPYLLTERGEEVLFANVAFISFVKVFENVHDLSVGHFFIQRPYHLLEVFNDKLLLSGVFFAFMIEVKLGVDFRIDDDILHFPYDLLRVD
jgi:hypothetical protein